MLELVVGVAIFMIIGGLLAMALRQGGDIWRRGLSGSVAQTELRKAYTSISSDLRRSRIDGVDRTTVPASLAGGFDGDALWFLSAEDPVTGEMRRVDGTSGGSAPEGSAFWQRNILYYTIVPSNHGAMYGYTCAGGSDATGYDDRCPHKMLVRQVIDGPDDSDGLEMLLTPAQIASYLVAPTGFDVSAVAGPNTEDTQIRAHSLLYFRVALEPQPDYPGEVRLDLRSARIEAAEKAIKVGTDPLTGFTVGFVSSVFPGGGMPAPGTP